MAHTVFTLHYITSRFQSGVMFLPGRRLYLHTERDAEPRRLGKHTVCVRVRSDIYDGECASTNQALNTLHLLCHVSVMCMYDTMFGLCKLSSTWRWKASWSLSRVLHSPVAHSSTHRLFSLCQSLQILYIYRCLIYILCHIWMCRTFHLLACVLSLVCVRRVFIPCLSSEMLTHTLFDVL